jgi:hypothetical protein
MHRLLEETRDRWRPAPYCALRDISQHQLCSTVQPRVSWGCEGARVFMREQMKLFEETERLEIPGATYLRNFVSTEEEQELIGRIEEGTWPTNSRGDVSTTGSAMVKTGLDHSRCRTGLN